MTFRHGLFVKCISLFLLLEQNNFWCKEIRSYFDFELRNLSWWVTWLHCVPVCNKIEDHSREDVTEYAISSYYTEAQKKIERKGQEQHNLCQVWSY